MTDRVPVPPTSQPQWQDTSFPNTAYTDTQAANGAPFRPTEPAVPPSPQYRQPAKPLDWKPYAIGAVLTALVLTLVYQQVQISHLNSELSSVATGSSDFRNHMDAVDTKLNELGTRVTYLDSKITATDQKAQGAVDRVKAIETRGNWFGNIVHDIGHSLGIQ